MNKIKYLLLISFFACSMQQAEAKLVIACSTEITPVNGVNDIVVNPAMIAVLNVCREPGLDYIYSEPYLISGEECHSEAVYAVRVIVRNGCREEASCEILFVIEPLFIEIYCCGDPLTNITCDVEMPPTSDEDLVFNICDIVVDIQISVTGPILLPNCDEKFIVTYTVKDVFGNLASCSRVVVKVCPCMEMYCTQTMYDYGGNSLTVCSNNTQVQKIQDVSGLGITIGRTALNRSFSFSAGDAVCVNNILPAAHDSNPLGSGNTVFGMNCNVPNIPQTGNDHLLNSLAGALIALKLNIGFAAPNYYPPLFSDLVFTESCYTTLASGSCTATIPISGTDKIFCLDQEVYDQFAVSPSILDIIELADDALAGVVVGVSLDQIFNTIHTINLSFQYCRFLDPNGWSTPPSVAQNIELRTVIHEGLTVSPNPAQDIVRINWESIDEEVSLGLIDLQGRVILQLNLQGDHTNEYALNVGELPRGIYFVRLNSGTRHLTHKVIIQ